MFWYKHSTGSHDDPDISDAMDEFGHVAYAVFFITLEIYGNEFNHLDSEEWLTISKRFLARKLRLSQGKVEQILNFYSERQRINAKCNGDMISIKCPKFIEIASNWTKRKNPLPTESLQRDTVVPTAKEEKKKRSRIEEKRIKKEIIPKVQFLDAVFLLQTEYDKLSTKYTKEKTDRAIEILNNGIMSKGYKYKSHYHTIIGWPMREAQENGNRSGDFGRGTGTPTQKAGRAKSDDRAYPIDVEC